MSKKRSDHYANMSDEELKITFLRRISEDIHEIKNFCLFLFALMIIGILGYIFTLLTAALLK